MNRIPIRMFTGEFKQEAVMLVIEQGLKKSEVSRRLDVSLKSLDDYQVGPPALAYRSVTFATW